MRVKHRTETKTGKNGNRNCNIQSEGVSPEGVWHRGKRIQTINLQVNRWVIVAWVIVAHQISFLG